MRRSTCGPTTTTWAAANPNLVKRVVYGESLNGLDLVAYKVTTNANTTADGAKPGAMFHGAQHAREWISAEVVRRGYQYFLEHSGDAASGVPAILASTEIWFIPVLNPDGYDYTFQTRGSRLWRKNLRDTNGNGTIQSGDGIDTNRNFSEKWRYDNEGASGLADVGHLPRPVAGVRARGRALFHELMARIKPEFYIDYHSYANLVLYPGRLAGRDLRRRLAADGGAGGDRCSNPSVAGYDPDVGGELYTTNGEITDTMYLQHGILSYTIELDGGAGAAVGGTTTAGNAGRLATRAASSSRTASPTSQAVFAKNLPFMLDLARSAPTPDQPVSHIGATGPGLRADGVPDVLRQRRRPSRSTCGARSATVHGQLAGRGLLGRADGLDVGVRRAASATASPGVYYHRMRGSVTGFARRRQGRGVVHGGRQDVGPVHVHGVGDRPRQPAC